jgi:hypothetical protein
MLRATTNEDIPLQVLASDGNTGLFAKVDLYRDGVVVETISLPHLSNGLYGATYSPTQDGYLSAIYVFFYDAGLTVEADYDHESELIEVCADKTNLIRILGLLHHNAVLDQQVYNTENHLVSARLRAYDSRANADLSGLTGLLFTWLVSAVYTAGRVSDFRIKEQP